MALMFDHLTSLILSYDDVRDLKEDDHKSACMRIVTEFMNTSSVLRGDVLLSVKHHLTFEVSKEEEIRKSLFAKEYLFLFDNIVFFQNSATILERLYNSEAFEFKLNIENYLILICWDPLCINVSKTD
jgi:hypothetical protein